LVLDAAALSDYDAIIRSWNGKTNAEKCLVSDKTAEFLSQLITPHTVIAIKPKYRMGSNSLFINAEKAKVKDIKASGLYRLTPDDRTALSILAEWSVKELDDRTSLPHLRSRGGSSRSEYDMRVMDSALKIAAELGPQPDEVLETTPVSSDLALDQNRSTFTRKAGDGIARGPRRRLTDAVSPNTTVYDHRVGDHVPMAPGEDTLKHHMELMRARAQYLQRLAAVWDGTTDGSLPTTDSDLAAIPKRGDPSDETLLLVAAELLDPNNGAKPTDADISRAADQAVKEEFGA
jgi:hypothetical protein